MFAYECHFGVWYQNVLLYRLHYDTGTRRIFQLCQRKEDFNAQLYFW